MDTSPAGAAPEEPGEPADETRAGDGTEDDEPRPPAHCSTGRLTPAQAATVDKWRARLRQDKPLPGQDRVGAAARMAGATDHPRASTSDAIAAAVTDLLRRPPEPLELAGYAYRSMLAQWHARRGQPRADVPACPPVSFYLPAELADQAEALRTQAPTAAAGKLRQAEEEAAEQYPGYSDAAERNRARYISGQVDRYGLYYTRQVPRGTIARMAIDRWAGHATDTVIAAAVSWCQETHLQWHRARHDMTTLRR